MTGFDSATKQEERSVADNPADALAAVVDNLGRLARAELRLAATEARAWLVRIGFGLVLLWLSLSSIQVFVFLLALSPVLLADHAWQSVALSLTLSVLLAAGVSLLAVRELRRLKDLGHDREPERH